MIDRIHTQQPLFLALVACLGAQLAGCQNKTVQRVVVDRPASFSVRSPINHGMRAPFQHLEELVATPEDPGGFRFEFQYWQRPNTLDLLLWNDREYAFLRLEEEELRAGEIVVDPSEWEPAPSTIPSIARGEIEIGMTKNMVELMYCDPKDIHRMTTSGLGDTETWFYGYNYEIEFVVHFRNGRVTGWSD